MEAIEAIMTRRSVRRFADCQIPDGYSPVGTIAFGHPAEKPKAHDKNPPNVTWVR
jgi:nitroreductase